MKRFGVGGKLICATIALCGLLCRYGTAEELAPARPSVEVHLYGGDTRPGAPRAQWYRTIGITDVWIFPIKGAFRQDSRPDDQQSAHKLKAEGTLGAYRTNRIRYWWFERPVPDFLYVKSKRADFPKTHLWDDTPETDVVWNAVTDKITEIYPTVRAAGFSGLVYDNEAYYSYQGDVTGNDRPWLWGGHQDQYGKEGNYYKRGRQVGEAISAVWPRAKVIMIYCYGYEAERWWYQGIKDGGVEFFLGVEHTYGAGPLRELGSRWYHGWWQNRPTVATCEWKRTQFPFISDNQHVIAGLFPIDFGSRQPCHRARYFREQVEDAASAGIPIWLWPQGDFTAERWQEIEYVPGDSIQDYLQVLRDFSQAF